MSFKNHMNDLNLVEELVLHADYGRAKQIIDDHIKDELKGNHILNQLKNSADEYEKILHEIQVDLFDTANAKKGMMARRDELAGKIRLAKTCLENIKNLAADEASEYGK